MIPAPDLDRYSRQVLFAGVGAAGQALLAQAHVAIVGVGGDGRRVGVAACARRGRPA